MNRRWWKTDECRADKRLKKSQCHSGTEFRLYDEDGRGMFFFLLSFGMGINEAENKLLIGSNDVSVSLKA